MGKQNKIDRECFAAGTVGHEIARRGLSYARLAEELGLAHTSVMRMAHTLVEHLTRHSNKHKYRPDARQRLQEILTGRVEVVKPAPQSHLPAGFAETVEAWRKERQAWR